MSEDNWAGCGGAYHRAAALVLIALLVPFMPVEAAGYGDIGDADASVGGDPLIRQMLQEVSAQRMYSTIYDLQNFTTRYTGSQGCDAAARYIRDRFNASGLMTEFQAFQHNGKTVRNVIATLPGVDVSSNSTYIISAHYDSTSSDPADAPGADDDGSGTAGVILAADAMAKHRFNSTLKFVAFVAEEQGLLGSRYYVSNINTSRERVDADFQMDMTISANTIKEIDLGTDVQWIRDGIIGANMNYSLGLKINVGPPGGRSDHASFISAGYNASMLIETYFSPYYHSPNDRVQNYPYPLGYEQGANTTQVVMALVAERAGMRPDTGSVSGWVTASNGTPLPGAVVSVGPASNVTAGDGSYLVSGIPVGIYTASASYPDHNTGSVANVTVRANTVTTGVNLTLVPLPGGISGHVEDASGRPLAGANVSVPGPLWVTTDPAGDYLLPGLPPGRYTVHAGLTGYGNASRTVDVYANTTTGGVDFTLVPLPGGISGRVGDAVNGLPLEGALVEAVGTTAEVLTGPAGGYLLTGLVPGSYELAVTHPLYISTRVPDVNVLPGRETVGVDVDLMPRPANISGRVLSPDMTPIPGAVITLDPPATSTSAGEDGSYMFGPLLPGMYTLTAAAPGYRASSIREVLTPGRDVVGADIVLTRVELPGWLAGRVLDDEGGAPLSDVSVRVRTEGGDPVEWRSVTDEEGRFNFTLPPGVYLVEVSHPGYRVATRTGLTVEPEGTTRLSIHLERLAGPSQEVERTPWMWLAPVVALVLVAVPLILLARRRRGKSERHPPSGGGAPLPENGNAPPGAEREDWLPPPP